MPLTFVDLSVQQVKNIEEPVRAYQVGTPSEGREAAARVAETAIQTKHPEPNLRRVKLQGANASELQPDEAAKAWPGRRGGAVLTSAGYPKKVAQIASPN